MNEIITVEDRTIPVRAFSVIPGTAFILEDQQTKWQTVWIIMWVSRNPETEVVTITARRADNIDDVWPDTTVRTFTRSFNTTLPVVGLCIHPFDMTDNDWGTD